MEILTEHIRIDTSGNSEVIDITGNVENLIRNHKIKNGLVTIFVSGSTASVTTTEYEPGLKKDIPEMLERLAPAGKSYYHNATWGDGNGHAHVRAAFLGPSLTVPLKEGALTLGTWQQIVLIDFDNKERKRNLVVQIMGE
jgi:secondary thiamine-phosphate synthase enzyme